MIKDRTLAAQQNID